MIPKKNTGMKERESIKEQIFLLTNSRTQEVKGTVRYYRQVSRIEEVSGSLTHKAKKNDAQERYLNLFHVRMAVPSAIVGLHFVLHLYFKAEYWKD
jgi:hypothetical protein